MGLPNKFDKLNAKVQHKCWQYSSETRSSSFHQRLVFIVLNSCKLNDLAAFRMAWIQDSGRTLKYFGLKSTLKMDWLIVFKNYFRLRIWIEVVRHEFSDAEL